MPVGPAIVATTSSTIASTTACYAAAVANAVKACGTVVRVEPFEFVKILNRKQNPMVVQATGGFFSTHHKYLTSYKGLAFYCKSSQPIQMGEGIEVISANKISIPDV
jgi:hypothetical protein